MVARLLETVPVPGPDDGASDRVVAGPLLLVAAGTYVAARLLGTWELYLLAFAFLAVLLVSWLLVVLTARRLTRDPHPHAGAARRRATPCSSRFARATARSCPGCR